MRNPDFITFTGADDRTSIDGMVELSRRYPIEWGVLFSPARQGKEPRYPSIETVEKLLRTKLTLSAHLCGGHSRAIMACFAPCLPVSLMNFSRIQVNHGTPSAGMIRRWGIGMRGLHAHTRCIAQTRGDYFPIDTRVDWLQDRSGGRGEAPTTWPLYPYPARLVGYAGGITPETVRGVIAAIYATGPYWIDIESGVRTDDWFDLTKCERVCRAVYGERAVTSLPDQGRGE